ncbi:MAG: DeoR/GlpR family DNA-binding transcription regulator [Bacteroidota bacterium]
MLKEERQNYILDKVRELNKVKSNDLAIELNVSEDTIRRDLNQLSHKGLILKVHGGALSTHQKLYHYNESSVFNRENKLKVAKKATLLLKNGQTIIMSGGTTNLEFSRLIPKELKLTIYTYSLTIAMQLTEHPNIEVILIGGKLHKKALVTVGVNVVKVLSKIKADICFLGTSGIDVEEGITEVGYEISFVKRVMIASSNTVVALLTSDKLNTSQRYPVCDLNEIHKMITDLNPDDPQLYPYIRKGVEVM